MLSGGLHPMTSSACGWAVPPRERSSRAISHGGAMPSGWLLLPPTWCGMTEFSGRFAATQIIGARERQEDDLAVLDLSHERHERFVFVLADGMGGHVGAADAAHRAVE